MLLAYTHMPSDTRINHDIDHLVYEDDVVSESVSLNDDIELDEDDDANGSEHDDDDSEHERERDDNDDDDYEQPSTRTTGEVRTFRSDIDGRSALGKRAALESPTRQSARQRRTPRKLTE